MFFIMAKCYRSEHNNTHRTNRLPQNEPFEPAGDNNDSETDQKQACRLVTTTSPFHTWTSAAIRRLVWPLTITGHTSQCYIQDGPMPTPRREEPPPLSLVHLLKWKIKHFHFTFQLAAGGWLLLQSVGSSCLRGSDSLHVAFCLL